MNPYFERSLRQFSGLVGRRHAECTFDNFVVNTPKQQPAVDAVRSYVQRLPERIKAGENLLLFGPPGTGKDHLMCSAVRYAIERGLKLFSSRDSMSNVRPLSVQADGEIGECTRPTFTWTSGALLAEQFRDAMKGAASTAALLHVDVLAVSDPALDGEMSDFQARELFRVIDHRYRHRLPVWITCNMESAEEFETRLTRQIADRLRDNATAVFFDWESHRKVKSTAT